MDEFEKYSLKPTQLQQEHCLEKQLLQPSVQLCNNIYITNKLLVSKQDKSLYIRVVLLGDHFSP